MKIREFVNLFNADYQYIRLYDLAENDEVCFEGQISEMDNTFDNKRIIIIEAMEESEFDGYLGIFIATKDEDEYFEMYNGE